MAVSFRTSTGFTTVNSGATFVLNVPTGTANGDLLVVAVDSTATVTAPAGWTTLGSQTHSGVGNFYIFTRTAASEPASYTFTLGGTGSGCAAQMHCATGVAAVNPINVSTIAPDTLGTSTNIVAASVTTTVANCALLVIYDQFNLTQTVTLPGGETLLLSSAGGVQLDSAWETVAAAGATGTRTATVVTADRNGGSIVAIAPGAGGNPIVMVI